VPRPDAEPVRLVDLLDGAGALPPLTACLGLAEDGRPLLLRLTSIGAAHALVAGESGAGKTELLRAMLISLAVRNRQPRLQIGLANPRSRGFAPLAGLPHLIEGVASDPAAARALLERLEWELDRREAEAVSEPHIVLAVDEIMDVVAGGPTAEDLLIRLTRFGRESGVHLLAGTRQPAAAREALPTARFPIRLVGRLKNGADAEAAAGRPGSRAEQLRGRGDFICISGGQAVPFQAAWVPAKDWAGLAAGL
jgi:S-DNA-T family DNA segregation ATPase FtsK/SpoIIIE